MGSMSQPATSWSGAARVLDALADLMERFNALDAALQSQPGIAQCRPELRIWGYEAHPYMTASLFVDLLDTDTVECQISIDWTPDSFTVGATIHRYDTGRGELILIWEADPVSGRAAERFSLEVGLLARELETRALQIDWVEEADP